MPFYSRTSHQTVRARARCIDYISCCTNTCSLTRDEQLVQSSLSRMCSILSNRKGVSACDFGQRTTHPLPPLVKVPHVFTDHYLSVRHSSSIHFFLFPRFESTTWLADCCVFCSRDVQLASGPRHRVGPRHRGGGPSHRGGHARLSPLTAVTSLSSGLIPCPCASTTGTKAKDARRVHGLIKFELFPIPYQVYRLRSHGVFGAHPTMFRESEKIII